jgi:hypothetical protein
MIINKNGMMVIKNAGNDKKVPALSTLHITADGDSIACNGKSVFIVEGVSKDRASGIPFEGTGKPVKRDITLPIKEVEKVVRNIPIDKQFDGLLELCHLEEIPNSDSVRIVFHDGKGEKIHNLPEYKNKYIDYSGILNRLYYDKKVNSKLILDRKRLIDSLQTMDKICGDAPAYIEVTSDNDLLVRSINHQTGQRVMVLIAGVVGEWLPKTKFEGKFYVTKEKETKKIKLKNKKKFRIKKKPV